MDNSAQEDSVPLNPPPPPPPNNPPSPANPSPAAPAASISLDSVASTGSGLTLRERTISDRREDARRWIAYLIVACFFITIAGSFIIFIWHGDNKIDDVIKLIQAIIAPVVAIVGAVTGFYFSNTNSSDPPNDSKPFS